MMSAGTEETSMDVHTKMGPPPIPVACSSRAISNDGNPTGDLLSPTASTSSGIATTSKKPARGKPRGPKKIKQKKKKKYESDDISDRTVRNAKNAKRNRDRKKKELLDLKEEVKALQEKRNSLKKEIEEEEALGNFKVADLEKSAMPSEPETAENSQAQTETQSFRMMDLIKSSKNSS